MLMLGEASNVPWCPPSSGGDPTLPIISTGNYAVHSWQMLINIVRTRSLWECCNIPPVDILSEFALYCSKWFQQELWAQFFGDVQGYLFMYLFRQLMSMGANLGERCGHSFPPNFAHMQEEPHHCTPVLEGAACTAFQHWPGLPARCRGRKSCY